jgi:hypothetical protein
VQPKGRKQRTSEIVVASLCCKDQLKLFFAQDKIAVNKESRVIEKDSLLKYKHDRYDSLNSP